MEHERKRLVITKLSSISIEQLTESARTGI